MTLKGIHTYVVTQMVIIVLFFAGMLLNYYALFPIIDEGEGARISADVENYCSNFLPCNGCDVRSRSQLDSVLKLGLDPYGQGDLWIIDTDGKVIYCSDGLEGGDAESLLFEKYGEKSCALLELEFSSMAQTYCVDYDKELHTSMVACYDKDSGLMFFYAIDYYIAGSKFLRSISFLVLFMAIGGVFTILFSYFTLNKMAKQLKKDSLVQQELDTAATIQKSMLPSGKKQLLQVDVDARLIPARKVGGDFFCYQLQDGLIYFCIGDVSGKGVPASLFMSKATTLFRSNIKYKFSVAEIAANMNEELCINNLSNMFLTCIIGTMSASDGRVRYVNAGHVPPVIWDGRQDAGLSYLASTGDVPLGLFGESEFTEEQFVLEKNGLVLFYTDGISEARSSTGALLGKEALLECLETIKGLTAKEINDKLLASVRTYESGTSQSDDITLLTFRNVPSPKTMSIRNDVRELRRIAPFTKEVFKECELDSKQLIVIRAGLDEALTNCVQYAYDTPDNPIDVTASIEDHCLCFTIRDSGKPFNPLEYISSPPDGTRVGGLGISMYRSAFDEVQYTRTGESNILKLIKKL